MFFRLKNPEYSELTNFKDFDEEKNKAYIRLFKVPKSLTEEKELTREREYLTAFKVTYQITILFGMTSNLLFQFTMQKVPTLQVLIPFNFIYPHNYQTTFDIFNIPPKITKKLKQLIKTLQKIKRTENE